MNSFSGHERNCLFMNQDGTNFSDRSLLSGVDNVADGRTFVYWDYNHDGWQDIALVNANSPLLNLYRNSLGQQVSADGRAGHIVALRYVGANRAATAMPGVACRDGYGARVELDLGHMKLKREHRCGEGFCAQNSATMIVGIGASQSARSVTVRWPSGKSQTQENVPHGTLLTAFENATESADGSGFDATTYLAPQRSVARRLASGGSDRKLTLLSDSPSTAEPVTPAPLRLYTTMATWCLACRQHLPQFVNLRSAFEEDQLEIYGVPVDEQDTPSKLENYKAAFHPAYDLVVDLTPEQRDQVQACLSADCGSSPLPSTLVTDAEGHVLKSLPGVPTVSEVRKWVRDQQPGAKE